LKLLLSNFLFWKKHLVLVFLGLMEPML
jgi:hypothetical protein